MKLTHEELFEAFYNVVAKETGKECIKFFNEQLEKAKNNEEDLQFLLLAIRKYRSRNMIYEEEDIFRTFEKEIRRELERTTK